MQPIGLDLVIKTLVLGLLDLKYDSVISHIIIIMLPFMVHWDRKREKNSIDLENYKYMLHTRNFW